MYVYTYSPDLRDTYIYIYTPTYICIHTHIHQISEILGVHDHVVVTAIPHAMDESIGALLPPFTGVPHMGNRTRVIKWHVTYTLAHTHAI